MSDMKTRIYGRIVPPLDYETLIRLERVVFGLTPSDWPDKAAHRIALDIAIDALATMRLRVRWAARAAKDVA